jgi:GT2 family glycosyltransferase
MKLINNLGMLVVTTTYNGQRFLAHQSESVVAELLPDDELIIVDDGSQDQTLELLGLVESSAVASIGCRVRRPANQHDW